MLNINLFGGPGVSKSTTAAGLMYTMKMRGDKVEFVTEFAKELTYGQDFTKLSDQLLILGEQHHRMFRLRDKVDFILHDSPFLMGIAYLQEDGHIPINLYQELIVTMFKSYNNLNIFLVRDTDEHTYQTYGRNQTLEEAIQKDIEIMGILETNNIPYIKINVNKDTVDNILSILDKG